MKQIEKDRNKLITGERKSKINTNQHRISEMLKEKNYVITLNSDLEMKYNFANISNS